jgi:hypothetical protein
MAERYALDPMTHHMESGIKRASDLEKVKQMLASTFSAAPSLATSRDYPILVAASGRAERRALAEIEQKHVDAHIFNCVPPGERTLQLSNMLFKLLSRQGARYHDLLTLHLGANFAVFLLLTDPARAVARLEAICPEARGAYVSGFIAYYGGLSVDRLTTPQALGELQLIALFLELSTLQLENGNAGIKHAISVLATHTKLPPSIRLALTVSFLNVVGC